MARSIWTGVISFGLVSVPVAIYSATQEHEVRFHQFQKGTSDRIRYKRVNERTGREVDYDNIVKGAEVGGGDYVMIEPDELDEIAPGRSRSLEIHQFVDLDEIDPIYYQKTYYLGPGSEETTKTYALLRDAMAKANHAAIGTLVMRSKEYLAAIRPEGKLLILETMFFADEIRDPKDVMDSLPGRAQAKPAELKMAAQLIDSMTGQWDPAEYRDTYTDRVKELIKAKKAGGEIAVAEEAPKATASKDLMEVLRRSIESSRERTGAKSGGGKAGAGKAGKRKGRKATGAPATKQTAAKKAKAAPRGRATASKRGGASRGELADMTKAELTTLARELDVAGRSSMDRGELEKAVAAARKKERRAA